MPTVAVFDARPYDKECLLQATQADRIDWRFLELRLSTETVQTAQGAAAVCIFVNDKADRACLEKLAALGVRHIALRCAGFNGVDLDAARDCGLAVTRVPAYSPHAVAEHAVALLLALNRKIPRAYNRVRDFNFSLNGLVGFDLNGKTAGLIGTGKIGQVTAEILRGFGMRVLAYDPYPSLEWAERCGVTYTEMSVLASAADVISLHVPLNPATHHIINRETLQRVKPGTILVNVSRGALIDTTALIEALKRGQLGGVALDVYEEEEGIFFEDLSGQILHDDELARLLSFPNVLITSHQAFLTQEALAEIARVTVANLHAGLIGQPFLEGTVLAPLATTHA